MDLTLDQFASSLGISKEQLLKNLGDGSPLPLVYNAPTNLFPPLAPLFPPTPQPIADLQAMVSLLGTMGTLPQVPPSNPPDFLSLIAALFSTTPNPPALLQSVPQSHLSNQVVSPSPSSPRSRKATQADFLAPVPRVPKRGREVPEKDEGVFVRPLPPKKKKPTTSWMRSNSSPSSSLSQRSGQREESLRTNRSPGSSSSSSSSSSPKMPPPISDHGIFSIMLEGLVGPIRDTIIQEEGTKFYEEKVLPYVDFKNNDPLAKINIYEKDVIGGKTVLSEWPDFSLYIHDRAGILLLKGGDGCDPIARRGPRSPPLSPAEREFNVLRKIVYWYTFLLCKNSTDHPMCKELALPPEREIDVNTRFHRAVRCLKAAYVRLGPIIAKKMKGHPSEHKLRMLKLIPTLKLEKVSSKRR